MTDHKRIPDLGADAAAGGNDTPVVSDQRQDAPLTGKLSLSYLQRRYMLGTSNAMRLQDDLRHLESMLMTTQRELVAALKTVAKDRHACEVMRRRAEAAIAIAEATHHG